MWRNELEGFQGSIFYLPLFPPPILLSWTKTYFYSSKIVLLLHLSLTTNEKRYVRMQLNRCWFKQRGVAQVPSETPPGNYGFLRLKSVSLNCQGKSTASTPSSRKSASSFQWFSHSEHWPPWGFHGPGPGSLLLHFLSPYNEFAIWIKLSLTVSLSFAKKNPDECN